jgi:hypothetical protein
MGVSDWVQLVSVGAVVVTLLLNVRQNREVIRQTGVATKQALAAAAAAKQASVQNLTNFSADFRGFIEAGPELLAWFLASRGIAVGTHQQNLLYMFLFSRMDLHEATFQSYFTQQLDADFWNGWSNTISTDVATAEFRVVWSAVQNQFSSAFATFVNAIIAEQDAR